MRVEPASSRLAFLCSGTGSNLQAVLDAIEAGSLDAQVVLVASDRPSCEALKRVPKPNRWAARPAQFADRTSFERAMGDAIQASGAHWIVCAGYMRILGVALIARFAGRLLNIHPSLLPRHRGLDTHARALAAGDNEHGASVHFVIPELDAGRVIAQAALPIYEGEQPEQLARRVLALEHQLLPEVLRWAVAGHISEPDRTVRLNGHTRFMPVRLDFAAS